MKDVYHSEDCDLSVLKGKTVAVIGYGIQGRAQALNLRDSGLNIVIGNHADAFAERAKEDGFEVLDIAQAASRADVLMLLIPDESHKDIFERDLKGRLKKHVLVTIAHGYSVRYKKFPIPKDIDLALMAPRFPGAQVRGYYVEGHGAPAFFDVIQDASGTALKKGLALGEALGFARAGLLRVSAEDETDLDLFVEHFMAPLFFRTMEESLKYLVSEGYPAKPAALELYLSGERGAFWTMCAKNGMYKTLKANASPTCQFGVSHYIKGIFDESIKAKMKLAIDEIRDGKFAKMLDAEEAAGYPTVKAFHEEKGKNIITKTEDEVRKVIRKPEPAAVK